MKTIEATNFIEQIINDDIESGKISAVQTRFPPEPNGYLHIGHIKSMLVNFGTAKKYDGKCNLFFDDTNPSKEKTEFVDAIRKDIEWVGYEWAKEVYASDFFEVIYEYAEKLITDGKAFVCDLSPEEISATRGTLTEAGKESPYRNRSVEENLQLFREMRAGKYPDGSKCLRAKIDMASPNMNMRDPVIYRILRHHHHRTGDKWCIYPMYDYAHPICDYLQGVTHSLCTLEFEDHRPLYDWVGINLGFAPKPRHRRHSRIIPAVYVAFFHQLFQIPLGHHGVRNGKARELNLTGFGAKPKVNPHPVVQRSVVFKFQGTKGMGHALQIVADRMREVVHRIDTPSIPRTVMRSA